MKGSVMDMVGIILVLTTGAITLFAMFYLLNAFKTEVAGVPMVAGNADAMDTIDAGINTLVGMDSLLAMFVIALCLVAIISAFLLPTHPVMFIVAFLLVLILVPVSAEFANMFESLYATGPLAGTEAYFPITIMIFQWLPKITAVMSFAIAIVMYGRSGGNY